MSKEHRDLTRISHHTKIVATIGPARTSRTSGAPSRSGRASRTRSRRAATAGSSRSGLSVPICPTGIPRRTRDARMPAWALRERVMTAMSA